MTHIEEKYEKSEVTGKIIKAAQAVHTELGPFYLEVVYQRALALELKTTGLEFNREVDVPIFYKGIKIDKRRADFVIEGCMVEIKAKSKLEDKDLIQLLSYLKSSGFRIGLLLNFGSDSLEVKRMINNAGTI